MPLRVGEGGAANRGNVRHAWKWWAKAVIRLMQQLQDRRTYSVVRSKAGRMLCDRRTIAHELVQYWSGVMVGGGSQ